MKMKAIIVGIRPVLDLIDGKPAPPPASGLDVVPLPPDPFVGRCREALTKFKAYVRGAACTAVGHALAVVRSLYPSVELAAIDTGFVKGTEDDDAVRLADEATGSALKLVDDLDLFGEDKNNNGENQG